MHIQTISALNQFYRLITMNKIVDREVIEITSYDQQSNAIQIPNNGDKIEIYGALVTDNPHGWNEIHPAWKVTILNESNNQ